MWVRLLSNQLLDLDGTQRSYRPGDWVNVGKQLATGWLAAGDAELFDPTGLTLTTGAGIVTPRPAPMLDAMASRGLAIPHTVGEPALRYPRTLLWDGVVTPRFDLLPAGFDLLATWEVAAPLVSYDRLAADYGTEEERATALRVCRDLRVPVYDPRLIFVRQGEAGSRFMDAWRETWPGGNDHLNLLTALYVTRPLLLALPVTWLHGGGRGR